MLSWDNIQSNAVAFSKRWQGVTSEKQQDQGFIESLLQVFGVDDVRAVGTFQEKTRIDNSTKWIDYLWKGKIAIEMKSKGESLDNALEQLREYMYSIPEDDVPELWLVSDFENIRISRRTTNEMWNFKTKDLRKHVKRFADIAGYTTERIRDDQIEVNVKAAEKMALLHDALKANGYDGHDLEVYLVRLLFCLFADDTGIFPQDSIYRFVEESKPDGSDLSGRISRLFEVLNMPDEVRAKRTLLSDELKQFRYINGGLFSDRLPSADFDAKMRQTLIDCINFDWNKISPAIFGAMFQGVMDKTQRREMGAHYTSEDNILKLINPLFLDDLWQEFDRVKTDPTALDRFHDKVARLKFLDPACGCGNFLIITYRELRLLELEILKMKSSNSQLIMDITPMLKVSVEQFFGIEYEDFPCQIAQVGMWLMDHQMNIKASEHFGTYYARLPLVQSATIVHANALRIEWESVVPKYELSYILGNPPFVGTKYLTDEQREDMDNVFAGEIKRDKLDYVTCWYKKASMYMDNTRITAAFVSTNSISQGEHVSIFWNLLISKYKTHIHFAHTTFIWSNEAKGKAAVHCVIIGFSLHSKTSKCRLYSNGRIIECDSISPYLTDSYDIIVEKQMRPISGVPSIVRGSQATDNGYFMFTEEEYLDFIKKEPNAKPYIKRFMMGYEFLNNVKRYCIWLLNCPPAELRKMPLVIERINAVREYRLKSPNIGTKAKAETPMLFDQLRPPTKQYLAFAKVSSQRRKYMPIGFLTDDVIPGDKLFTIPNGTLYMFGILMSNVHNAWIRAVAGRLKSDYSYSTLIVYNAFPWPSATAEQKAVIETLAQAVLDARELFPDNSLTDLYDPNVMPPELLKAHQNLDRAVMKLYGFSIKDTTEASCVAALMEQYQNIVSNGESK